VGLQSLATTILGKRRRNSRDCVENEICMEVEVEIEIEIEVEIEDR
jgi:hypothetical protein